MMIYNMINLALSGDQQIEEYPSSIEGEIE